MTDVTIRSRLSSWAYALRTTNPPPDGPADPVTRWLVITRAAVLPMSLFAGLVAALLAVGQPGLDWRWLTLAIIGILLAHTVNNLMNDLFDTQTGPTATPILAPSTPRIRCCRVWSPAAPSSSRSAW